VALSREIALDLLETMWRIRSFEERVVALKRSLQVYGLIHVSIGGEGVAAGVCRRLRPDDVVYSGHRAHGHAIAKGMPLPNLMAELMGRVDGCCKGLGGSMHLVDRAHGFLGATGVVGGNLPLALGSALAAKEAGGDNVAVVFFGDGAVQAGHFHETVNLAALWQLPLIFVCENNGFAEFTPRSAHTVIERVSDVVAPYRFERETVDGGDAGAAWETFGAFLETAREGGGPLLLECLTHRRRGHYEGDAQAYREALEDEEWEAHDPVARLRQEAIEQGWLDEARAGEMAAEAAALVEEAVAFARGSPLPDPQLTAELVYAPA
jgi:pyruvate dehydrogenase E1 component alpha subunit